MDDKTKPSGINKKEAKVTGRFIQPGCQSMEELRKMVRSKKNSQKLYIVLLIREVNRLRD